MVRLGLRHLPQGLASSPGPRLRRETPGRLDPHSASAPWAARAFLLPGGCHLGARAEGSLIPSPTRLFPEALGPVEDFLQGPVWAAGGAEQA